jgi:hypothetical protein
LHPVALLFDGKVPVVFGLRTDEGILLLFPPSSLQADALGRELPVWNRPGSDDRGSFQSVLLPVSKGGAATAFATIPPAAVERWYAAQVGRTAERSSPANEVLTVAVDVVQTTSDESPTIVVRATRDVNERRRSSRVRPLKL